MARSVLNGVQCPRCSVGEHHPNLEGHVLIRVRILEDEGHWYSQCLVCAGWWNEKLQPTPGRYEESKGWFEC